MDASVDYLVVGAGASGLAFVDAVFSARPDATFAIVDRRDRAGGHWADAYPYVMLHQPAVGYGVGSRPLGSSALDGTGFNDGMQSLASGVAVADHFQAHLRDVLLPSGRVRFLPMTEHVGDGECVSLLSGQRTRISAGTIVRTLMETSIPLTHRRSFTVAEGVACVPPNELPRAAAQFQHFVVLGAGKTGVDAVLWLLSNGAAPSRITWVVPRDPWMVNRAAAQTGPEGFRRHAGPLFLAQMEVASRAATLDDLCLGMEERGVWLRLDGDVWPTMQHCGTVTTFELDAVRRVEDVVRLGRVSALEIGSITLQHGVHQVPATALHVDCTASALADNVGVAEPVFGDGRIDLQMIRLCQPTFSAALIGHMESTINDHAEKASLSVPVPMPDTVADWAANMAISMANQARWSRHRTVRVWLGTSRLNFAASWPDAAAHDEAARSQLMGGAALADEAMANLQRLGQSAADLAASGSP